ncbi:MAG TPA: hypothetical protein VMB84_07825, partial [Stellaceae bacterium]|nr:hypothetical protein [Stellaceae bacterium]
RAHWRRAGQKGMAAATLISFAILGVWHGAGWQFALYGLAFGVLAVLSLYTLKYRDRAYAALGVPALAVAIIRAVITFFLFALVLVLFRANYLGDAVLFYRDIFSLDLLRELAATVGHAAFGIGEAPGLPVISGYAADWLLIAALVAGDIAVRNGLTLSRSSLALQTLAYNAGVAAVAYQWMAGSVAQPFLYYKF